MLGIEALGVVEPGSKGDLIVVEGDPLLDLATLGRPWLVVSRGRPLDGPWNARIGSMRN